MLTTVTAKIATTPDCAQTTLLVVVKIAWFLTMWKTYVELFTVFILIVLTLIIY